MNVVVADKVSKWYGHVLGVSELSWTLSGGIVGLLGPNAAGKSTLMKMTAGLLRPSLGTLNVFGASPFFDRDVRAQIGYAPEHEATYDELTAHELVKILAELAGVPRARSKAAADQALEVMGMTHAATRVVRGFSKGMRQRVKLAGAIAHDPSLILFDEPLTGVDPEARASIIKAIGRLAAMGKTIVISSHVLYEIEALTSNIVVIYRGQLLAQGDYFAIRKLIDRRPHRIAIECDRPRELASLLAGVEHVTCVETELQRVIAESKAPDLCYAAIATAATTHGIQIRTLTSPDNNLAAVFDYLTEAQ